MTNTEMLLKEIDYHLMMARGKTVSLPNSVTKTDMQTKIDQAWDFVQEVINTDAS